MYRPIIDDKEKWLKGAQPGSDRWRDPRIGPEVARLPAELLRWLYDLRLLRGVPLSYLVPDPAMLPAESVRFFHLDPTWTDRLMDGALAAGNIGTIDQGFSANVMSAVRAQVDEQLAAKARIAPAEWSKVVVTGLLFRSVIVRRWPTMAVRAYKAAQPKETRDLDPQHLIVNLRKEVIAPGILLVLFAGLPKQVDIEEPHDGTQFGCEEHASGTLTIVVPGTKPAPSPDPKPTITVSKTAVSVVNAGLTVAADPSFTVAPRNDVGALLKDAQGEVKVPVTFRGNRRLRVLKLDALRAALAEKLKLPKPDDVDSARLALCLQQTPFVQVFKEPPPDDPARGNRLMTAVDAEASGLGLLGGK